MSENRWQPIETAPKDGRMIVLATDYERAGHDRVRCGYWVRSLIERWISKDADTQVRDGWIDNSGWQLFGSIEATALEMGDEDEGEFIRGFDPTHWMPLPSPPGEPA